MLADATRARARAFTSRRRIAALGPLVLHAVRRMGWGVADQGVSSLTNFAVNIYIAHELGAAAYGAFALAYVTYHFALNASRGLSTDPLMVRFSATDVTTWRRAVASSTGTATVAGLVTGGMVLAVTPLLGGSTQSAFLALGLTLPGLLLQDSWRFAFFAHGRGALAVINDTVWAVGLLVGFVVIGATGHMTVFWVVFVWGASAALGAALGPLQARVVPRLAETRRWLTAHWDLAPRYLAEGTTNSASAQAVTYGIGLLLGLAALGAVQAASLLMGPYMVLLWGISLVLMPEAVRLRRRSSRRLRQLCVITSVTFSVLAAVWGIALLVALPIGLGQALLGPLWHDAYPLVVPTTLYVMASVTLGGAGLGLHALGAAKRSLRATIITAATYAACSLIGATVAGAMGAVTGGAVGMAAGAVVFWWELRAAMREPPTGVEAGPGGRAAEPAQPTGADAVVAPTAPFAEAILPDIVWFATEDAGDSPIGRAPSDDGDATPPCRIWPKDEPSGPVGSGDGCAVNVGVRFQASSDGVVTGVRFYKARENHGTHVGSLWTTRGTLLATGTFTDETPSGWQELQFPSPVPVMAATTYVASYHTSTGHYAFTADGLAAPVTNGPLTALGGGGVYSYDSANAIPTDTFHGANYWVDVVYAP